MKFIAKGLLVIVASFSVLMAGFVALSWAPDVPVERLKAKWASEPSTFISVAGVSVHVRDQGPKEAPVLVLLHGTSASLHTWEGWVKALPHYRVVSLDLPGFGLTEAFKDDDFTLANYSRFLAKVFEALNIDTARIAGNSFGGQLAWQFAVDYPDKVTALVLVDASGYPRQSTSVPLGFKLAGIPALRPVMANILPRSLIESSVRNVYGDPNKVTPELIDRYYDLALREGNRAALRKRFAQYDQGVDPSKIQTIKTPTLILWGGKDGLIHPSNALTFHQDIEGSELKIFDALGHVPQEEDPEATVEVVKTFLAKVD